MKILRNTLMAAALSVAALTGLIMTAPSVATAAAADLRLFAPLTGLVNGVQATGDARFRDRTTIQDFNVNLSSVNAANGTILDVLLVQGKTDVLPGTTTKMGTIKLKTKRGALDLSTATGDNIPKVVVGDVVLIQYQGTTVMTGVFGN